MDKDKVLDNLELAYGLVDDATDVEVDTARDLSSKVHQSISDMLLGNSFQVIIMSLVIIIAALVETIKVQMEEADDSTGH